MEIDPQSFAIVAGSGFTGYVLKLIIDKTLHREVKRINQVDHIPSILMHLEQIKANLVKMETKIDSLQEKKNENLKSIIILQEKTKAAWKSIEELKLKASRA